MGFIADKTLVRKRYVGNIKGVKRERHIEFIEDQSEDNEDADKNELKARGIKK